jgi:hypothetical protein
MPTPVVHLFIAQNLLRGPDALPAGSLNGQAGDFLLGSVAPDAWTVSNATRRQTHLLPIPLPAGKQGAVELLATYPHLRAPAALTPAQAAFVAGYLAHLLADEVWYHQIFDPFFARESGAPDLPRQQRMVLHNVLRLHCERQLQDQLDQGMIDRLAGAEARYDFPLLPDTSLRQWRERLSVEMRPGVPKRSAEVFAQRMGLPAEELTTLAASPAVLQGQIMPRLPAGRLEQVMQESIAGTRRLVRAYLEHEPL